jgi:sialate O-acetylesterase
MKSNKTRNASNHIRSGLLVSLLLLSFAARAEVKPNSLFADNCVLQRGVRMPVWGTATSGEKITVTFAGQTATTIATNGVWKVWLEPMQADATPETLTIRGDMISTVEMMMSTGKTIWQSLPVQDKTYVFTNVLVGDVWVASGQSNMERQLGPRAGQPEIIGWREAASSANFPDIHEFYVPEHLSPTPNTDAGGNWVVCSPQTAPDFSAVGFFFARALHQAEKVPVGILFSAWGGTPAEAWTSASALKTMNDFRPQIQWMESQTGTPAYNAASLTVLYNAMIAPLQAFPIKGVIWYQGESNCDRGRQYQELFPLLIADWRQAWGLGDFPFLFVQIAPSKYWTPEIREAQLLTLKKTKNTAMIGTADIGDANDMHPAQKAPVGERLALAARALAYGEKIEYSGPLFKKMKIEGDRAVISFTHTDGGLVANGGELRGFTIASADKKFVPAKAEIKGKTVVVWSDEIKLPAAVRYGWAKAPDVNLFNEEGLPASPFRTDDEQP